MAYFSRNDQYGAEFEFEEYDSTPYGGGYDLGMTYGRPLEPSDEICYRRASSCHSAEIHYQNPSYGSHSQPSAYGDEALAAEYSSYARPNTRIKPSYAGSGRRNDGDGFDSGMGVGSGGDGEPHYGHGRRPEPEYERKTRVDAPISGYDRKTSGHDNPPLSEYGSRHGPKPGAEASDFGSGYRRHGERTEQEVLSSEYGSYNRQKPDYKTPASEYGSDNRRKSDYEAPDSEYGSDHRRRSDYEAPDSKYGSDHRRRSDNETPGSEYGPDFRRKSEHKEPDSGYGSGFGRESEYEAPGSEYAHDYGRKTGYRDEGSDYVSRQNLKSGFEEDRDADYGTGYGRKTRIEDGETGGYGYGGSDDPPRRPTHGRSNYERSGEDESRKYTNRGEGYGGKKHGGADDDDESGSDDGRKNRREKHRHHRKNYD